MMHYPRYTYADGGLTSLKQARDLLHRHAPEGEHLAYINPQEAALLKEHGGSGVMTESGIRSYGLLKKITKPFAKVLDKIVPNEIKPALPFIAAAVPFLAPAMIPGLTAMQYAAISAGANAASQLSQEGAAKYGINPISLGLSALSGYGAAPGAGQELAAGKILGTDPTTGAIITKGSELAGQIQVTPPTFLQSVENVARGVGSLGADTLGKGTDVVGKILGPGEVTGSELLTLGKTALPGQAMAVGDLAYNKAQKALDEYDQQQAALGAMGVANTESRKAAIRNAMQLSGYTNDEIENTILKFKFATGGRVGYEAGSNNQGVKTIPINLDAIAKQLFGDKLDNLTYTQKETVYNRYYDLKDKKAKGGLMSLGGNEMDFRASGGFVPIGKKERADDVPARLSKNEFVFTAKAVRNAGGGDIKQGAKKMYQLMKNLEARA